MKVVRLDNKWRRDHPLPGLDAGGDKGARGRVLLAGGSRLAPGALRLAAEAVLRVGAGKVRIATVEEATLPLGVQVPEAGVVGLPADDRGEIAGEAASALAKQVEAAQVLAFGPGMRRSDQLPALLRTLLAAAGTDGKVLLDAAPLVALRGLRTEARALAGRLVLTPHPGELAGLLDMAEDAVLADMVGSATRAAREFGAVVAFKSAQTVIATPDGAVCCYENEARGLGTAGSGDVLAGTIAGLMARGADPLTAAGWGVWLHGEAGQAAARAIGPLGFLARDLLPHLPMLMAVQSQP
ncbi:NAD(P)H-hydrate dehydratase [Sphingomonas jeddahensis]|uniref:ADP-dependent (S)-NAD(P)H-hydrate dehydratase n=1 Tax=Sphingomonas jeddahensis TaxID=1915074 RepID=A0A1V2ESF9_9SPHN|nr:Bifunctional NAD(P)H-hydrate repair enzyme Nnr [Sphingomonas jeddahensis]